MLGCFGGGMHGKEGKREDREKGTDTYNHS